MSKNTVDIKRSASYLVINKYALRILKRKHKGAERVKLITLYTTLLWMADDIGKDKVIFYNNGIRTYSGLPKEWITQGLKTLENDGLIEKKIRKVDGKYKGLIITIQDYFSPDLKANSPESWIPETRNSEFQKTVPGFSATIEDYTKENILSKDNSDSKESHEPQKAKLEIDKNETEDSSLPACDGKKEKKEKKEKSHGREDLNNLEAWLKQIFQREDWKENSTWQRRWLQNLMKLTERIGKAEFAERARKLSKDDFNFKHCGSLQFIHKQIKSMPVSKKKQATQTDEQLFFVAMSDDEKNIYRNHLNDEQKKHITRSQMDEYLKQFN